MIRKPLLTSDVRDMTGWSLLTIRNLIASGKLKAINTSAGKRPTWRVLPESLEAFLEGTPQPSTPKRERRAARKRIDADVPKVFG